MQKQNAVHGESHAESLNSRTKQQINNIERIVNATTNYIRSEWFDVVKQNLENIEKIKEIAAEAKILMEMNYQMRK